MPEVNRKQALLPAGCLLLENFWGTAPAFALQEKGTWFICLPGVPHEMRSLFAKHIRPLLTHELQLHPHQLVTLRTTGLGESTLQERLEGFNPSPATLGFRALTAEVQVKLRFPQGTPSARIDAVIADATTRIGSSLFAVQGHGDGPQGSLAQVIGTLLTQRQHTLCTAESCTGGLVSAALTAIPGSSAWFQQGFVTYSNGSKTHCLGVPAGHIQEFGAVSQEVAIAMATGARRQADTTWAIATTGIAGPSGGTPDKPVGLVHIALSGPGGTQHRALRLPGARSRVQALATAGVLDLLRRSLIA